VIELRHSQVWNATGPGQLDYEIKHWGVPHMNDGRGVWNYYVYLREAQLTPDAWAKVWPEPVRFMDRSAGYKQPIFDEYNSALADADWHGGITFYERHVDYDCGLRHVKVGCDFSHYWDRDRIYDLERVQREAVNTCEKLAALLTPLARCSYTGQYFDPAFIADVPGYNGVISPAGLGARSHWELKRLEEKRAALTKAGAL
jgi:hypothetical protein